MDTLEAIKLRFYLEVLLPILSEILRNCSYECEHKNLLMS